MPIRITYTEGTKLIVLFDNNQKASLKQEFLEIVKSGKKIEDMPDSDFEKYLSEKFSRFTDNFFITCKSGNVFFPQAVCSLEEIKKVLVYFSQLCQDNMFDILKGNWRSFVK